MLPLPGLPDHRLLTPGSPVLVTAARELADSTGYITFLAPVTEAGEERLVRLTVLDCARPPLDHLLAAVLLSPPGERCGLTPLQLPLLGLLVDGTAQVRPMAALGVDARTAADTLATVLAALGTADLTTTTLRAVRTGLRIPPQLAVPPLNHNTACTRRCLHTSLPAVPAVGPSGRAVRSRRQCRRRGRSDDRSVPAPVRGRRPRSRACQVPQNVR